MKIVKTILALFSKKLVAKYLPEILAVLFTKLFRWLLENDKRERVIEVLERIIKALNNTVESFRDDGKYDTEEIIQLKEDWESVLRK